MGREGIEPLVVHLAYFLTTVLQTAAKNTTLGNSLPSAAGSQSLTVHCLLPTFPHSTSGSRTHKQSPGFEPGRFTSLRIVP